MKHQIPSCINCQNYKINRKGYSSWFAVCTNWLGSKTEFPITSTESCVKHYIAKGE